MNNDLMTFKDVCEYFGLSAPSLRRLIARRKRNESSFPSPILGWNRRGLWRRSDIENWTETETTSEPQKVESPEKKERRLERDRIALKKEHNINVPCDSR